MQHPPSTLPFVASRAAGYNAQQTFPAPSHALHILRSRGASYPAERRRLLSQPSACRRQVSVFVRDSALGEVTFCVSPALASSADAASILRISRHFSHFFHSSRCTLCIIGTMRPYTYQPGTYEHFLTLIVRIEGDSPPNYRLCRCIGMFL